MFEYLSDDGFFEYLTEGNIKIKRKTVSSDAKASVNKILELIDSSKGALFSSSYEYPGRYSRWDIGFVNPCLELRAKKRSFAFNALNKRGEVLLGAIYNHLKGNSDIEGINLSSAGIEGTVKRSDAVFSEEERSKQPSIFSVIRAVNRLFSCKDDKFLGFYGGFGYDLVFQFDPIELKHERPEAANDLVLFMPDRITVVDHRMAQASEISYEFIVDGVSTEGIPVEGSRNEFGAGCGDVQLPKTEKGKYASIVRKAIESFKVGDMFEVVPSHTLYYKCSSTPSEIFNNLKASNPSPYGFIINMGGEYLVGSSPEMYVRVENNRVETCPISGTIKRGKDAIEDAEQIKRLLNSYKDESELTMCTDVDRNDKSRICIPGTVKVIGRRQCEFYSHLIHTVDHVEGYLRPEFDSLDAFMTHMWAVTITGAPKKAAISWIENQEDSCREWYGGAVGYIAFNGDINTGLTLRTIKIENNGVAKIRAGATLLIDSVPEDEEEETYVKAAALVKAVEFNKARRVELPKEELKSGAGKKILFVDHEDSFVHTLADYFRQTGASVVTLRSGQAQKVLASGEAGFDLIVLSPGPGRPEQFNLNLTIKLSIERGIPIFGVCLGLQGLVEYFGGRLGQLDYAQHGKSSRINADATGKLFAGLPEEFCVGRYHSLYAAEVPECLKVTAVSEDNIVMAVEHRELAISAVQFHPESIMTLKENNGLKLVGNVVSALK
ncbi:anthranilate synthase component I [Anaerobacterium chartisolvens]|uniref:Anthranilate synthase n=1 Tax=Anaerobacterium chartisolvens TaxID=1297424 RepID=A0A369B8Q2_9FIRM|nr:anthranilate synthase component I [Anaerobacterium chartisolvens]RCX16926.1 anthranilate synthase component I [Anaerobacterium chartisolvens]